MDQQYPWRKDGLESIEGFGRSFEEKSPILSLPCLTTRWEADDASPSIKLRALYPPHVNAIYLM
jgi:hypothetical protein